MADVLARQAKRLWPLVCLLACMPALALTETGAVGSLHYALYAPDWTWQGCDVNVLAVFENAGPAPAEVTLRLFLPPGKEDRFAYDGPGSLTVTVPADGSIRKALTNIKPLTGFPLDEYPFAFEVDAGGQIVHVAYPLQTIRGQVFSGGRKTALCVPAGAALVWCIVVALALRRFAQPGAWKAPSPPCSDEAGDAP